MDSFRFFLTAIPENFTAQFRFLKEFLAQSKRNFDLMITDFTLDGSLVAAEVADMPTVVVLAGLPGASERVIDKMEIPLLDLFVGQLFGLFMWPLLLKTRSQHNLPELKLQNFFYFAEYTARFPSSVAWSPMMYPEPHTSLSHLFIGGIRNESHYDNLESNLQKWLDLNDEKIVYISLGTTFKITDAKFEDWIQKIRNQNAIRFFWSVSNDMLRSVNSLNPQPNPTLFLTKFLPQFTLLGHRKVEVFITHGGLGSVTDVVKRRKPAICCPQLFDQPYNCGKLESLGAGLVSSFEFDGIMEVLQKVFSKYNHYVDNANRIAEDFESYEKIESIENFLSQVAAKKKVEVIQDFGFELCSAKCTRALLLFRILAIAVLFLTFLGWIKLCKLVFNACRRVMNNKSASAKAKLS